MVVCWRRSSPSTGLPPAHDRGSHYSIPGIQPLPQRSGPPGGPYPSEGLALYPYPYPSTPPGPALLQPLPSTLPHPQQRYPQQTSSPAPATAT